MIVTKGLYKDLIKIALATTPLIATIMVMPMFMRKTPREISEIYIWLFIMCFLAVFWAMNIGLVVVFEQPHFKKAKKRFRFPVSYTLSIAFAFIAFVLDLGQYFAPRDPGPQSPEPNGNPIYAPLVLFVFINTIILVIQELVLLKKSNTIIATENEKLKTMNTEAHYQQLKQQLHPHFLFNSLNTLKVLINRKPESATQYLVNLSDFLRGSLSIGDINIIRLEQELRLCSDYLEMQKIRFGNSLTYSFSIPDDIIHSGSVPPFSIQLLLENAIKHNILLPETPLNIQVAFSNGIISVCNNLQKRNPIESQGGLGLSNLSERYRIICGEGLEVNESETVFCVKIRIIES